MRLRRRRFRYNSNLSFLDLLFCTLLGFVALFYFAFVMMNPKTKKNQKVTAKAEYILTISWPKDVNDDVDSYLEDPLGNLVFFRRREDGLMHLDRDDQGHLHDYIQTPLGMVKFEENREIITIRGIIPGEYTMNVHMFAKRSPRPVEVTIHLEKLNPTVKTVALKKVMLHQSGDEKTAFRFKLDREGDIESMIELEKPLANKAQDGPGPGYYSEPSETDSTPTDEGLFNDGPFYDPSEDE